MADVARSEPHTLVRSIRERNGVIEDGNSEDHVYPGLSVDPSNIMRPTLGHDRVEDIFIEKSVSLLKKVVYVFQQKGTTAALQVIADHRTRQAQASVGQVIVQRLARFILRLWRFVLAIYVYFYPFALKSPEELTIRFNRSLDWQSGVIRVFEWHPNFYKCAVCLINDIIYIRSSNNSKAPLLKHALQKKVVSISWHPQSEEVLAVGCQSAILIWTILDTGNSARVIRNVTCPVECVTFDPSGAFVAACSPQSSKIWLIKVNPLPGDEPVKIIHCFGSCFTRFIWSPDKMRIFAATTSKHIHVFEDKEWSSRSWTSKEWLEPTCQAACWSHDGRILLVVPFGSSVVYAITFFDPCQPKDVGGSKDCFKVIDAHKRTVGTVSIGGVIHDISWDQNSQRLAISFKENVEFIQIYHTKIKPIFELEFTGLVHGLPGEVPLLMSFHQLFSRGSLLSVCWDSGFVSLIPFEYKKNCKTEQQSERSDSMRPLDALNFFTPPRHDRVSVDLPVLRDVNFSKEFEWSNFTPNHVKSPKNRISDPNSVVSPKKPFLFSESFNS